MWGWGFDAIAEVSPQAGAGPSWRSLGPSHAWPCAQHPCPPHGLSSAPTSTCRQDAPRAGCVLPVEDFK